MNRFNSIRRIVFLLALLGITSFAFVVTGWIAVENSLPSGVVTANVRVTLIANDATPIAPYGPIDPAIIPALQSTPGNRPFAVLPGLQPVGVYLPGIAPRDQLATITPTVIFPPLVFSPTPTSTYLPTYTVTPTPTVTNTPTTAPSPTTFPPDNIQNDLGIVEISGLGMTPNPQLIGDNCAPKGLPVDGILTQRFNLYHSGIDLGVTVGTPVLATQSGQVIFAGWSTIGYGWLVVIQNGHYITYYAHNSSLSVSRYDYVQIGQLISFSGSTGNSSGPHVHYETRIDTVAVDPLTFEARGIPSC